MAVRLEAYQIMDCYLMAEVTLTKIYKSFGEDVALNDLTMTVPDGSFVVLLGPTGAGKTTTLRIVSGLDKPDRGQVYIGGRDMSLLTPAQRNIAMVFQQYSLYPHLTVRENLEFPLKSPTLRLIFAWGVFKAGDFSGNSKFSLTVKCG